MSAYNNHQYLYHTILIFLAGSCPAKFGHYRETGIIQNDKQCFGVSEKVTTQNVNMNTQRAACTSYDTDSELMEEHGAAWCEDTFINHIMV